MTSLATRHVMQANKGKDTKPELVLRHALRAAGYPGYRLHWKDAAGHPDITYPGRRVAIFVNGCFWHRCSRCKLTTPKTNTAFWEEKFARNRERDRREWRELVGEGWCVVVVWEHDLKRGHVDATVADVVCELERAGDGGPGIGRMVEIGSPAAWELAARRGRLRARGSSRP